MLEAVVTFSICNALLCTHTIDFVPHVWTWKMVLMTGRVKTALAVVTFHVCGPKYVFFAPLTYQLLFLVFFIFFLRFAEMFINVLFIMLEVIILLAPFALS